MVHRSVGKFDSSLSLKLKSQLKFKELEKNCGLLVDKLVEEIKAFTLMANSGHKKRERLPHRYLSLEANRALFGWCLRPLR